MKKMKINYPFIITVAIIIIYLLKTCSKLDGENGTQIIIKETTDTIIKTDTIHRIIKSEPELIAKYIKIPIFVDTLNIIRNYFTKNFYSDTISDSCFFIIINDTIYENLIVDRSLEYQLYKDSIFITKKVLINTIVPRKNYFSLGTSFTTSKELYLNGYYSTSLSTFGIGYDITSKNFQITYIYNFNGNNKNIHNRK